MIECGCFLKNHMPGAVFHLHEYNGTCTNCGAHIKTSVYVMYSGDRELGGKLVHFFIPLTALTCIGCKHDMNLLNIWCEDQKEKEAEHWKYRMN